MRPLAAYELLDVWEHGRRKAPFQRALLLLAAASPEESLERLAELSLGQRDSRLLTLRAWTFGERIAGLTHCPTCGSAIDLAFDVEEIRAPTPTAATFAFTVAEFELVVRLLNSYDIGAITDEAGAPLALLRRCIIAATSAGAACDAAALPAEVAQAVASQLAQADPQADVQLALRCPQCANAWEAPFDIAAFFWSEIEAWAARMFQEIHVLAAGYGWPETAILALSPLRRRIYLEMLSP